MTKQHNHNTDIRPFTRQFYRGNGRYITLALVQTVLMTAGNLTISWLIQQMVERIKYSFISVSENII